MTRGPDIEVWEFDASTAPQISRGKISRQSARSWSRALGLLGTLSLHGLAIHSLALGSVAHKPRPLDVKGAGASALNSAAPAEELVVVAMESSRQIDPGLLEEIALLGPRLTDLPISVSSPDPLPAIDSASAEAIGEGPEQQQPDSDDPAMRALMFGRYTGQIGARIERAWVRPRSPVQDVGRSPEGGETAEAGAAGKVFKCRVQIRQDSNGNVQEVLLLDCDGAEAWRRSLVVAINQSSPLPAPPTAGVFTPSLTISFEAHEYTSGDSPDAYERVPREGLAGREPGETITPPVPTPVARATQ